MTLFNHSFLFCAPLYAADMVSFRKLAKHGIDFYETRALCCTHPGDVIQLDPRLREDFPFMREHYKRIGLDCTAHVVWSVEAKVADDFPEHHLSAYIFIDAIHAVRPDAKRLAATKRYADKNNFMRRCKGIVPIPKTIFAETAQPPDYTKLQFPLYVKGAVSSGGSSAYLCKNRQDVTRAIGKMQGPYQLQEAVDAVAFLGVEYNITPQGDVEFLAQTQQILDGVEYVGTRFPAGYEAPILAIARRAAQDGVRGKIGFDVAVTADNQFFVLECNPRWNGATYPLAIAGRLGIKEWSTAHVPVAARELKHVNFGDAEYNAKRGTGVILVNWGVFKLGWIEVMLVGTPEQQQALHRRIAHL